MIYYQSNHPTASPDTFFEASIPQPPSIAECDADEFRIDSAAIPLECGLTAVCRAAADAETGGPAGRPAFAAPKRPPPREGAIDTRRVTIRAIRGLVKARLPNIAALSRLAFRNARRVGRRTPRRVLRFAFDARGDSGDGSGEASAPSGASGRALGLGFVNPPGQEPGGGEAFMTAGLPPVTRAWLAEKPPRRPPGCDPGAKAPRLTLRERREARRQARKARAREAERTRAEARERELQAEFDASFHHPWGIR